jgi:hypothetical protein
MLGQETLIEPPAVLLFKSVPDSLKPIVGALMPLVGANSKQLVATAATWFGYILDCDSIPAVLALRGMCWRGLRLRNQAVDDLLRASWRAGTDEELVRQIAYGYAGLTLAETGYGVHRDNSLLGDSLLRRALVYYDSAIQFEAGAYAMDMFIRSFRERVRTTLGEDQKEVDRTKPSRAATRLFCTGMLLCIVGALAAIFELVKR